MINKMKTRPCNQLFVLQKDWTWGISMNIRLNKKTTIKQK